MIGLHFFVQPEKHKKILLLTFETTCIPKLCKQTSVVGIYTTIFTLVLTAVVSLEHLPIHHIRRPLSAYQRGMHHSKKRRASFFIENVCVRVLLNKKH